MPERQSRHPDNDLIDEMQEGANPSHQGRSGGDVPKTVGTRGEKASPKEPDNREPVIGSDNPEDDAKKGPKTRAAIQEERNNS